MCGVLFFFPRLFTSAPCSPLRARASACVRVVNAPIRSEVHSTSEYLTTHSHAPCVRAAATWRTQTRSRFIFCQPLAPVCSSPFFFFPCCVFLLLPGELTRAVFNSTIPYCMFFPYSPIQKPKKDERGVAVSTSREVLDPGPRAGSALLLPGR